MKTNPIHKEIKANLARSGMTLTEVVSKMNMNRAADNQTTIQNISNKIIRGTIKYRCDIACSTVYRKGRSNLPLESVMKQYSENAKYLFCTGNADRETENEQYGIVEVVTDVIKKEYSTKIEGNADIWSA